MKIIIISVITNIILIFSQSLNNFTIARIKYSGGGDWYNDPSTEVNLLKFVSEVTNIKTNPVYTYVELSDTRIFNYPMLFITGHGNIYINEKESENLKKYIENGGFLYIDDDYSLDKAVRRELKRIFPQNELMEIPVTHPIYNSYFQFKNGPPKIHKHDEKPAKGLGIYIEGRLAIYYTVESNPSDGWADKKVHNDSDELREKALQFGTNIIVWLLSGKN